MDIDDSYLESIIYMEKAFEYSGYLDALKHILEFYRPIIRKLAQTVITDQTGKSSIIRYILSCRSQSVYCAMKNVFHSSENSKMDTSQLVCEAARIAAKG